jgi:LmbE family N-acetylglucosaminyl deacetylase
MFAGLTMRILAVGADDVELGCGDTLALYKKGHQVYVLVLTRGEASGDATVRENECKLGAGRIGVDQLFFRRSRLYLRVTPAHNQRRNLTSHEESSMRPSQQSTLVVTTGTLNGHEQVTRQMNATAWTRMSGLCG